MFSPHPEWGWQYGGVHPSEVCGAIRSGARETQGGGLAEVRQQYPYTGGQTGKSSIFSMCPYCSEAAVAQLLERSPREREVVASIPNRVIQKTL